MQSSQPMQPIRIPCIHNVDLHHLLAVEALAMGGQPDRVMSVAMNHDEKCPSSHCYIPNHAQRGALAQQVSREEHGLTVCVCGACWVCWKADKDVAARLTPSVGLFCICTHTVMHVLNADATVEFPVQSYTS